MSEVKVNKISPRTNCGTVTLGDSGDTFTIPTGATINNQGTALNFGATGSASWNTTVKTTGFTAVAGEGYFCDTSSGGFSVNLPAGSAGDVVAFKDYANTFDTGTLTLIQNGSDKIGGSTVNANLTTEGIAVTLVFVDSTRGWLVTDSGLQDEAPTAQYIQASGGTPITSGDYKIHVFTGPGSLCVSNGGNASGSNTVEYLVVGGGGAGGTGEGQSSGGGGGGGFRSYTALACASPLNGPAALPVSVQSYAIVVGAGGASESHLGPIKPGSLSSFSTITSAGGGAGRPGQSSVCGSPAYAPVPAMNGGSGGGGTGNCGPGIGGVGDTPPVSPAQGRDGGNGGLSGGNRSGGGGGGAINEGTDGAPPKIGGPGGAGAHVPDGFFGTGYGEAGPAGRYFAGGGGGGVQGPPGGSYGTGGLGGGGAAGNPAGTAGSINMGAGGGSGHNNCIGSGIGGSGIVIIRYKFQN